MPDAAAAPNVLLILTDQLRPFELGCHGHPLVPTPHIDRLAAAGVRFEHAVTTNPVCTPARASLLSGQYSRTCTGMLGNVGEPAPHRSCFPDATLAERLVVGARHVRTPQPAYETALVGKWHVGPHPRLLGFQETLYPKVNHLNVDQTYFDGTGRSWTEPGFAPELELRTAQAFLRRERQQPFFLFHSISLPHMPHFDLPPRYRERFRPDDMLLRPNCWRDGRLYHDEHAFRIYLYDYLHYREHRPECDTLPAGYDLRRLYADYCGAVTAVDDQVGALLDALNASGQRDNTLVIFTADHGDNLGSHHRWNKISPNEEAIRIPFIVSWPGRLTPRVVDTHVASLADVAPTVLGLLGRPPAPAMQGRDLTPVLRGSVPRLGAGEAYLENLKGEIVVRTPSHAYAAMTRAMPGRPEREVTDDALLFHDLRSDPFQQRNLARTGEQGETAAALRNALLAWNRATPWMSGSLGGTYGDGRDC